MIYIQIDLAIVKQLIIDQCHQYSNLLITPLETYGTSHALYRLGNDYLIRLPKIDWENSNCNRDTLNEFHITNHLSPILDITISTPIFLGNPCQYYQYYWSIIKWHDGDTPKFETNNEYSQLAIELAKFINQLHTIKIDNIDYSRRGGDLSKIDSDTRQAIHQINDEFDGQLLLILWDKYSKVSKWDQSPRLIHGDLLPGNILLKNKHLNAVIDFTDVGLGDPACDLIIAWSLFNQSSRNIFRNNLNNIDDSTWIRGMAWALSIAVVMLPYYKNTNIVMANLARTIIKNLTREYVND
jgi:aminoglycoside phosphotransferase (APT) family kinase protein